jgi:hypothetical protein
LRSVLVNLSFNNLFVGRDQQALAAADEGLASAPDDLLLMTYKAHALMFLGRRQEARQLYLGNIGKERAAATWEYYITDDFRQLKAAGRTNPLMEAVLKAFAAHTKTAAKSCLDAGHGQGGISRGRVPAPTKRLTRLVGGSRLPLSIKKRARVNGSRGTNREGMRTWET